MKEIKKKTVLGYKIWEEPYGSFAPLKPLCRALSSECAVLLKNEGGVLPFSQKERIAVFGRMQCHYNKSGHGSGGNVRAAEVPSFMEALRRETELNIDKELSALYERWVKEHPFDNGHGWATEPFCQEEMPLSEETVRAAAEKNDKALVIIGRASGEDKDNKNEKGSFLLNDLEEEMLRLVCENFSQVALLINSGNVMDISFIERYNISAVMYVWQCGEAGALSVADMLCGRVSPTGKLADTQARQYADYPSSRNFDGDRENLYEEDIYVGYRYFETFAPEKVLFPFGFGLTYTEFSVDSEARMEGKKIIVTAAVKNIGDRAAKETVEVYYGAPQGRLGNPKKQLIAFKKTGLLAPGESERVTLSFPVSAMASYDDEPQSENAFCYVLEKGEYKIFAGTDSHSAPQVLSFDNKEERVVKRLRQALAPVKDFERLVAAEKSGKTVMLRRPVPKREYSLQERVGESRPQEFAYTGDRGIKLVNVFYGENTLDEFVAQLGIKELCELVCGEGMSSWKVKRGATGAAMGGVTPSLSHFGIPVVCLTDGPAGLRFDGEATGIPIGTALACSFNTELVEEMATLLGIEIFANDIDILLGCGMNIHRDPLCGRNFEYFSEDPLIAGSFAAAMYKGISKAGGNVTIKHFAGNGQERNRRSCDSVVSERALREIYLKGFQMAVEAGADVVMTAYNPINGNWAATNYDLTTTILRGEWGFNGFVMSDWWADLNWDGGSPSRERLAEMLLAGNDIYMVCPDATSHTHNINEKLREGFITIGTLQAAAKNILRYILTSPSFLKFIDGGCVPQNVTRNDSWMKEFSYTAAPQSGQEIEFSIDNERKTICVELEMECLASSLAQIPVTISAGSVHCTVLLGGTDGKTVCEKRFMNLWEGEWRLKIEFGDSIKLHSVKLKK